MKQVPENQVGISPEWVIAESKGLFAKEMGVEPGMEMSDQMKNAAAVVGLRMYILGHERGYDLCKGLRRAQELRQKGGASNG